MPAKIHLIYFSPTRTTQSIVEQVSAGLNPAEITHYDLTRMKAGLDLQLTDGLAIIGMPVYAGRMPEICLERLRKLSATGIPAVLVALYGNRAFEDALLELRDVVLSKGFGVVASGAFIGEHSYSTNRQPIAADRPDTADRQKAKEFGAAVGRRLQAANGGGTLEVPGDRPYKERVQLGGIAPETDRTLCTLCGTCSKVCPSFIIRIEDAAVQTDAVSCLMCCACVKRCPAQARALNQPMVETRRQMLYENCRQRKEPEFFF